MALGVQQWQDEQSLRLQEVLDAATPPLPFEGVTVAPLRVATERVVRKARRVISKLTRRS